MRIAVHLDAAEVKRTADFVAIASRYTRLRRAGRQFVGLCPFHSEHTPSFYVDPQWKLFKCFGRCAAGGDIFDFVMLAEQCSFAEALRIVAGVARESEPRSGERFRVRVGGEAPSARAAGAQHSPNTRDSIVASLDAAEARVRAIHAANEADAAAWALPCESSGDDFLLVNESVHGAASSGCSQFAHERGACVSGQRTRIADAGEGARSIFIRHRITSIPNTEEGSHGRR